MQTNIIINLQTEGLHHWPEAKNVLPQVGYLSNLHRHIFHIECKINVTHDNRDIEFIDLKHKIYDYLTKSYYDSVYFCLNFNARSCEMIAKELFEKFNLNYCKVLEDNENGAEVKK